MKMDLMLFGLVSPCHTHVQIIILGVYSCLSTESIAATQQSINEKCRKKRKNLRLHSNASMYQLYCCWYWCWCNGMKWRWIFPFFCSVHSFSLIQCHRISSFFFFEYTVHICNEHSFDLYIVNEMMVVECACSMLNVYKDDSIGRRNKRNRHKQDIFNFFLKTSTFWFLLFFFFKIFYYDRDYTIALIETHSKRKLIRYGLVH